MRILLLTLFLLSLTITVTAGEVAPLWVYVGTGAKKEAEQGIYRYDYDPATGKLTPGGRVANIVNPSYITIHPNKKFIYAVSEVSGKEGGTINAFAIDPATGKLTLLNKQSSGGSGPCWVSLDRTGKFVLTANYNSGVVAVLPIKEDGSLEKASSVIQHTGSSVDKERQKQPYAHSMNVDAANRFAIAADLGADRLFVYRFDAAKGTLTPNDPPSTAMDPGAGPRHLSFHPNGKFAYVTGEMASTLTAFSYDADKGELKKIQVKPLLPNDFKGKSTSAHVLVHPSGKFVYASNRGHDSITEFAINQTDGTLTYVAHQTQGIKTPRNFNIDPAGKFMIVANQDGNDLVVFRIDQQTGELQPTGIRAEIATPMCVQFMAKP